MPDLARAALQAAGLALFLVIGTTVLFLLVNTGWMTTNSMDRIPRESAGSSGFILLGVAAMATFLTTTSTRASGKSPRLVDRRGPALMHGLLSGPLAGIGLALVVLGWRAIALPESSEPGVWNDYLSDPLCALILAGALWTTINLALALGTLLAVTRRVGLMLVLGLCIVIGLLGGAGAFFWLHQAEPGIGLLLGTWGSIPFTLAALLGSIALRRPRA
jgi:hypothetical protein